MKKWFFVLLISVFSSLTFGQVADNDEPPYFTGKSRIFKTIQNQEADPRLGLYDVKQYVLDLNVRPDSTYIEGQATIRAAVTETPVDTLVFELIDELTVDSVFIDEQKRNFVHQNDLVKIPTNQVFKMNEVFLTTIFYQGISEGSGLSTGYNKTYDKHVAWTLSESFHAREWFPCKQVLSDKADSARIILTTPDKYTAVSNGLLTRKKSTGDQTTYHWETYYPINYYLISFSVADYQEYNFYTRLNEEDSLLVQNFVYDHPDYLDQWKSDIDRTSDLLKLYSAKFGQYPFIKEKYGHSLMERGGGMEHQTISTMSNFNFILVAHELTHQWFGDYVTCASWQDIWINEGFASYGEYIALENLVDKKTADEWMKQAHKYALQEPEGSVYIPFEKAFDESRIFNFSLSYKKGAALLHMIRYLIDDDALFFEVLKNFLDEYKNDVASGEDFKRTLHTYTNVDFTDFFDQWYYGQGYPNYKVRWENSEDSVHMQVIQSTSSENPDLFTIPLEIKLQAENGEDTIIVYQAESNHDRFSLSYSHDINNVVIDPDNWILNKPSDATRVHKEEFAGVSCRIYPNPVNSSLEIQLTGTPRNMNRKVVVRDLTGKTVLSGFFKGNQHQLNVEALHSGIYFLEIQCKDSKLMKRFVKP